jgi:hypothetical protein
MNRLMVKPMPVRMATAQVEEHEPKNSQARERERDQRQRVGVEDRDDDDGHQVVDDDERQQKRLERLRDRAACLGRYRNLSADAWRQLIVRASNGHPVRIFGSFLQALGCAVPGRLRRQRCRGSP